jgi:hypothetical protein
MKARLTIAVLLLSFLATDGANAFRLFAPSSPSAVYSRPNWEANGNFPFRPRKLLQLNINGTNVTVDFGDVPIERTPEEVAEIIRAAIAAQAPGSATVSVVGTSQGGAIRIEPTQGTVTVLGGLANTDLQINALGTPPKSMVDPWDPPPFAHWDLREFTDCKVPFGVYGNATNTTLSADQMDAAVVAAFQSWEDVAPAIIRFLRADQAAWIPGHNYFQNDGWNVVYWGNPPELGRASGRTRFRFEAPTGKIMESDIVLNDHCTWVNTGMNLATVSPWQWDIQGVTTHEVGHFIGLAHVPGPGAADDPTMSYGREIWGENAAAVPNFELRSLSFDDRDGCNFLYTPDLGDAEDPAAAFNLYPSKVHSTIQWGTLNDIDVFQPAEGADHFFGIRDSADVLYRAGTYQYEWLGPNIDDDEAECEARVTNDDDWDDGVDFFFDNWGYLVAVEFDVQTNGRGASRYAGDGGREIYVNGWLDSNNDKSWAHPAEWLVNWHGGPGHGGWPDGDNSRKITSYVPRRTWPDNAYFRMRLDWGENVGLTRKVDYTLNKPKGAAQLGEVEDYVRADAGDSTFHGWHSGFDTPFTSWPLWDFPGSYWDEIARICYLDAPWWWRCYTWPPPVVRYEAGVAVPVELIDEGWTIGEVSFKEYTPTGGGTTQAVFTPDDIAGYDLNSNLQMDDGTIWFGFSLENYELPEMTMVMYFTLVPPPTWTGHMSTDLHYTAGNDVWGWSKTPYLNVHVEFGDVKCGDADGNGIVNISDAVFLISYIFGGGSAPDPYTSGDADCNEIVNISDAVYLIAYIFGGGPVPCAECP